MAISTNGTVIARLAGGLYNTVMSNATYLEVAAQDPSTLANTLYTRDFAKSTDLAVATTLVTNLGLSTVAGLDNWVAAQLTAAGSAKGAKIVSLLNDFAGMAADATYGAAATAFNTKVDAALAASQKTGSVESKFEAAGTVPSTAATFTLTTGVDGLDKFTGGAGNDTFNATNADLGSLDSIDGGAGTNTLSITDTGSIGARVITAKNIQIVNASSATGSVGNAAAVAKLNAQQTVTYTFTTVPSESIDVTVGGIKKSFVSTGTTFTTANVADWINEVMTDAYGAVDNLQDGSDYAVATSDSVITVAADDAGVALPTISFAKTNAASLETLTITAATVRANQVASAAVTANTFTVPTGATSATLTAATEVYASSVATADTTVVATGGTALLSGGNSQTITAGNSVTASGSKGPVVINVTVAPATELTAASGTTGWDGGAGIYVTGGSTVTITDKTGTSTAGSTPAASTKSIQVGADPLLASTATNGALAGTTATTYPQTIGNIALAPTGNVSITKKTTYTDTLGYSNVKYGTGPVDVFMNGGTTASVQGAAATTIRDMQTIKTQASLTAESLPGTSKLETVNLTGVEGAVAIHSDALKTISVTDMLTERVVTVNSNTGANSGTINLNLANAIVNVVHSQATAAVVTTGASAVQRIGTSLTLTSPNTLELDAGKVKTLTVEGTTDLTIDDNSSMSALTTVTSKSAGKLTLVASNFANLTKIDASDATGALVATIDDTGDYGMTVTGGAGGDTVTLAGDISSVAVAGATVKTSISLGAGSDKLKDGGGSVAEGAVIDAGSGTDNLAATLIDDDNAAIFKNFEILDVAGLDGLEVDASSLTESTITGVTVSAAMTGGSSNTATITDIAGTALTVSVTKHTDALGSLTATLADSTGTTDTAAVTFSSANIVDENKTTTLAAFTTEGIESVSIASGGTNTYVTRTMSNVLTKFEDTSNTTKTITITGASAFTLTGIEQYTTAPVTEITTATVAAALKTIDASAATGNVTVTAGLTVDDIHSNTATTDLVFTGLTIKGGAGDDTLRNDAAGGVVTGGAGDDTITLTGAATTAGVKSSANGGDGDDTIIVGGDVSTTLTGGDGEDEFDVSDVDGLSVITTITDYSLADDTINLGSVTDLAKASATLLTGSLTTQIAAVDDDNDTDEAQWFVFDGNTYIVANNDSDQVVVKLIGVFNLTTVESVASGLFGEA